MSRRPFSAVPNIFASEGTGIPNNIPLLDADFASVLSQYNDSAIGYNTYAVDTGTANNYVVTLPVTPSGYSADFFFTMLPANSCTGASVVNVNSLGNQSIVNALGNPVVTGDIVANQALTLMFDGTNFRIMSVTPTNINLNTLFQSNRFLYDDFNGDNVNISSNSQAIQSALPWQSRISGTGSIISSNVGVDATNLCSGVLQLSGTGVGGGAGMHLANLWGGLGNLEFDARFLVGALPTSAQNYTVFFGVAASTFALTDNALLVVGNFTGSAAQFVGQASLNSVTTSTSALTWSSANAIRVKFVVNTAWNSVSFFAGGVQIGSAVTSNLPIGKVLFPFISISGTAGAAANSMYLDTFSMTYQYASP